MTTLALKIYNLRYSQTNVQSQSNLKCGDDIVTVDSKSKSFWFTFTLLISMMHNVSGSKKDFVSSQQKVFVCNPSIVFWGISKQVHTFLCKCKCLILQFHSVSSVSRKHYCDFFIKGFAPVSYAGNIVCLIDMSLQEQFLAVSQASMEQSPATIVPLCGLVGWHSIFPCCLELHEPMPSIW